MICSSFPRKYLVFHPFFDSHTYKITTTTAQFTFYDCKLHFTTAEIVISYTLKYAPASMNQNDIIIAYASMSFTIMPSVDGNGLCCHKLSLYSGSIHPIDRRYNHSCA